MFALQLLLSKRNNIFVIELHVAVSNVGVLVVVTEVQQWVHVALLPTCRILCTGVNILLAYLGLLVQ